MNNLMSVKQTLKCGLNMPEKWHEDYNGYNDDNNKILPDYAPMNVYSVDEYSACPNNWKHGSDIASSYFASLKEDWALWLDFNECFNHTHDVAIVLSVQGINPITGQTMIGNNPLRLEQYYRNCPIHNKKFEQEYFCEECGFKWPGQNYIATTGTPFGMFWIDGFRAPDGKVRQYIITAEKMRGVAAQIMDNPDDRVFAIGMAFYLSKVKKPEIPKNIKKTISSEQINSYKTNFKDTDSINDFKKAINIFIKERQDSRSLHSIFPLNTFSRWNERGYINNVKAMASHAYESSTDNDIVFASSIDSTNLLGSLHSEAAEPVTPVKNLEVGAGALVNQMIYDDPKSIEYWDDHPIGTIYFNYCDEKTLKKILDAGKRADKKDGFMNGIQVGG